MMGSSGVSEVLVLLPDHDNEGVGGGVTLVCEALPVGEFEAVGGGVTEVRVVDHVALRDPVGAGVTLVLVMEFDGVVLRDDEIDADRDTVVDEVVLVPEFGRDSERDVCVCVCVGRGVDERDFDCVGEGVNEGVARDTESVADNVIVIVLAPSQRRDGSNTNTIKRIINIATLIPVHRKSMEATYIWFVFCCYLW